MEISVSSRDGASWIRLKGEFDLGAAGDVEQRLSQVEHQHPPTVVLDLRELIFIDSTSVRHAGLGPDAAIGLRVEVLPERIRVEVSDPGPGFEPGGESPSIYQDSGWGLYLVEQVATRWGVELEEATRVWFEIDRDRL